MNIFDFSVIDTDADRGTKAALLAKMLDTALDAMIFSDEECRVMGWAPATVRLFGWTADEAVGRFIHELIVPPDLVEKHLAGVARLLRTDKPAVIGRRIEIEAINKAGVRFPVELGLTRIKHKGRWYFAARLRDISNRKSYELKLLQAASERASKVNGHAATLEELLSAEARDEAVRTAASALSRVEKVLSEYRNAKFLTEEKAKAGLVKLVGLLDDPYLKLSVDFFKNT